MAVPVSYYRDKIDIPNKTSFKITKE
jgi:hypothetical protein